MTYNYLGLKNFGEAKSVIKLIFKNLFIPIGPIFKVLIYYYTNFYQLCGCLKGCMEEGVGWGAASVEF